MLMQREFLAVQALCNFPLAVALRTNPARVERVPAVATSTDLTRAGPATLRLRMPAANGTRDIRHLTLPTLLSSESVSCESAIYAGARRLRSWIYRLTGGIVLTIDQFGELL